jgi:transcriptional regulator with XRE-family HTH domain
MANEEGFDGRAQKSLYRPENQVFLATLRAFRTRAGLTQRELAERLGRSQNYATAAERGVVRLDGLQIRDWCQECGVDLKTWAAEVEKGISTQAGVPSKRSSRAK